MKFSSSSLHHNILFNTPFSNIANCYINTLPRVETVMIREQSQIMTEFKNIHQGIKESYTIKFADHSGRAV
jgi:hypothetical protein